MQPRDNKFPFTDFRVGKLRSLRKRRCYYDTNCPGLELRVSPSGYKVFSFVGHRGRRTRIGQCPPVTVQIAREVANEKRICVELGVNSVQRESLGELWEKYRQNMADRGCKQRSIMMFERCFRHLEHWKNRRLERLTPDMVLDQLKVFRDREEFGLAKNTMKLLSAMIHFAVRRGWVGRNPLTGIKFNEKRTRTRFVEPHELFGFISNLEERKDVFGDLVLFVLFTGVRRSEAFSAAWADFDLERKKWRCTGKLGIERTIYLSDYVLEILRRRRKLSGLNAAFVFENPFTDRPLTWVRLVMFRAELAARGLPLDTLARSVKNQFSLHTLRHTFITYALRAMVPVQVLQAMVGHTTEKRTTIAVYAHSTEEWEREGFQKVADHMRKLAWEERPGREAEALAASVGQQAYSSSASPNAGSATNARPADAKSLSEQKAAYLEYFKAKVAASRASSPEPRRTDASDSRPKKSKDILGDLAREKALKDIVAFWRAGKSVRQIARLMADQGIPINYHTLWRILSRSGVSKRRGPSSSGGNAK
jgi:integrase